MVLRIPDRVVLFDYGEVISFSPSQFDREALVELAGVRAEDFWSGYWVDRAELDQGRLSTHDYWVRLAGRLGVEWSNSRIQQLWVADYRGWLSINPDVFDILAELHEGGSRLYLLSNAGFDYASYFRHSPMARFFDRMFLSAEMDLVKPDSAIYVKVLDELGIAGEQMLFIDNKPENVEAAAGLGIVSHSFVSADDLRMFLAAYVVTA